MPIIKLLSNPPNFNGQVLKPDGRFDPYWQRILSFFNENLQQAVEELDVLATGLVIKAAGVTVGTQPALNLIEGTAITIQAVDNVAAGRIDITINATSSYNLVEDPDFWFLE